MMKENRHACHKVANQKMQKITRRRLRATREKFQDPTISRSPEILRNRMLFRIPTFPAYYSVSLLSRTNGRTPATRACEFIHFASGDFIAIHSDARFMRRCVDTRRIKCRSLTFGDGGQRTGHPLSAASPELRRKFIRIYHRSFVNARR